MPDDAAEHGTRIAIGPIPFSMSSSIPLGAEQSTTRRAACSPTAGTRSVRTPGPVGTFFEDTMNNRLLLRKCETSTSSAW